MIARARLSAWLLAALACGAALPRSAAAQTPDDLREARTKGRATAPVTMYIMSDFECPYCGDFARGTFQTIERDYVETGKMRVVFVNFPLTSIHPNAEPAAEVAMCAARQNKFWAMHDLLFRHQDAWVDLRDPGSYFLALGDSIGADRAELTACLTTHATRPLVQADAEGSARTGAHSTPSFYIEGGLMAGDQPMDVFRPILDSIIQAKTRHPAPAR
ncbi:MAG TPA: DsbA family protein [Gemmatimonadales bacterium]|nr:DsbA family protein [Gemmatimonadales bacterium]